MFDSDTGKAIKKKVFCDWRRLLLWMVPGELGAWKE
jgi:hypothetical protein